MSDERSHLAAMSSIGAASLAPVGEVGAAQVAADAAVSPDCEKYERVSERVAREGASQSDVAFLLKHEETCETHLRKLEKELELPNRALEQGLDELMKGIRSKL